MHFKFIERGMNFIGKFVVAWKKTCQCNAVGHRNKGEIGVMILHTELHLQLVQVLFHWHFPFTCSNCNKLFWSYPTPKKREKEVTTTTHHPVQNVIIFVCLLLPKQAGTDSMKRTTRQSSKWWLKRYHPESIYCSRQVLTARNVLNTMCPWQIRSEAGSSLHLDFHHCV